MSSQDVTGLDGPSGHPLDFSLENLRQHPRNEVKQLDETLEFLDSTKQPKKNDKMILLICY